ncbi:MAG TPA: TetR/AcrR family transcriptional regulator [Candidatus Dormibacteraeota bacterium]|nr:TetR/AcrR family transcriptional regulator [Candidatus Dormibacteraeota bacterium]
MPKIHPSVREGRRQRFIDAAWRCAARKGFRDTTVDDVCNEIAASKGAFYGYFASKRALLLALLDDDAADLDEIMAALDRRGLTAVECLRRFTKAMVDRGADQARAQVRADLWATALTEPEVRDRVASLVGHRRVLLRTWVRAAVENGELALDVVPNAFAAVLLALGDGLMLHNAIDASGFRWPNIARALDEIFAGLAAG